ncbi:hypothetical protein [Streptomyces sp. NPDC093089]|uniref:hypothetical protein n=1 Tax=Streptomyces sp. NPDC093089 TaxID=3366024 RepID=UPI00381A1681
MLPCRVRRSERRAGEPLCRQFRELNSGHATTYIDNPLAAGTTTPEPQYAAFTNSTYGGPCYGMLQVAWTLAPSTPRLHFDEARFAYARFHPLYADRYGTAVGADTFGDPTRPTVFATPRHDSRALRKILTLVDPIMNRRSNSAPMACLAGAYWLDSSAFLRAPATRRAPVDAATRHVPQQKRHLRQHAHPGADNASHCRGELAGPAGPGDTFDGGGAEDSTDTTAR